MGSLNSDGEKALWSALVFAIIATIGLGLRFLSRRFTKANYGADDWLALISLVLFWAQVSVFTWGDVSGGGGADVGTLAFDPKKLKAYLQSLFIVLTLYYPTAAAIKFSILCLYRRIFDVPSFRRVSFVTGMIVLAWFIASEVAALVSCVPPQKFWYREGPGYCFNFDLYFLGVTIPETLLDAFILALPVRMVMNLQLCRRDKAYLIGIFLLGGFVVITGIIRLILTYQPNNRNVSFTKAELWWNIHTGTAILCACLPTYRPLLKRASVRSEAAKASFGSSFSRERATKLSEEGNTYALDSYAKKSRPVYNELNDSFEDTENLTRSARNV